ncbi:MAG: hypothetical protein AAGA95_11925, partial [Pseudomonadota bacterium]
MTVLRTSAYILITTLLLSGCGGGGGSDDPAPAPTPAPAPPPAQFDLTVTTTGLQSDQRYTALLEADTNTTLDIASGAGFQTQLTDGESYTFTITLQPETQFCSVANGSGTVAGADVDITVACVGFAIGGTTTGLAAGETLGLSLNSGAQSLSLSDSGAFSFDRTVPDGTTYDVAITATPIGKSCSLTGGSGTVNGADVDTISINCVPENPTLSIGGTLTGLNTDPVTLQQSGGDDLLLSADGDFSFVTLLRAGDAYDVSVAIQPQDAQCSVTNGAGVVSGGNVSNVEVTCVGNPAAFAYSVGTSDPSIGVFSIDSLGRPAERSRLPVALQVRSVTVDPAGKRLYTTNNGTPFPPESQIINSYDIDPATGALTANGLQLIPDEVPGRITFHPTGRFAFTTYSSEQLIAMYDVDPVTGALTEGPTYPVGMFPGRIAFDQSGQFLFLKVFMGFTLFEIDQD